MTGQKKPIQGVLRVIRRLSSYHSAASIVAVLALICAVQAQTNVARKVPIKNFGCINENFYRGAQPDGADYKALAGLGVKTVIDLQRDGRSDEKDKVEGAG